MIISRVVTKFTIKGSKEEICTLMESYLDSVPVNWEKITDVGITYKLIATDKLLWIGDLVLQNLPKGEIELLVVYYISPDNPDHDDLCISKLRKTVKGTLNKLYKSPSIKFIPIIKKISLQSPGWSKSLPEPCRIQSQMFWRNFKKSIYLLDRPITPNERKKLDQEKEAKKLARTKEGFYSRVFFEGVVRTNLEDFRNVLQGYIKDKKRTGYWKNITVEETATSPNKIYELLHNAFGKFGCMARIEAMEINDIEIKIRIMNLDDKVSFCNQQEAQELYFQTIEELHKLAEYIKEIYRNEVHEISTSLDALSEQPLAGKKNLPGRKRYQDYDSAYEKVREGFSYSEASKWWKENYPEAYKKHLDSWGGEHQCYIRFVAAMNYRNRKSSKNIL